MDQNMPERWIINKASKYSENDVWSAKAWLITARTLFPRNFEIQVCLFSRNPYYRSIFSKKVLYHLG